MIMMVVMMAGGMTMIGERLWSLGGRLAHQGVNRESKHGREGGCIYNSNSMINTGAQSEILSYFS